MIVRGVEDAARQEGLTVILCNTDENTDIEAEYINVRVIDGWMALWLVRLVRNLIRIRRLKNEVIRWC